MVVTIVARTAPLHQNHETYFEIIVTHFKNVRKDQDIAMTEPQKDVTHAL